MVKLLSGKTFAVRAQNFHLRENFHGSMFVDLHYQSTRPSFQCVFRHLLINPYISVVSPQDSVIVSPFGDILTSFNSTVSITCGAQGGPNNMFEWRQFPQGVIVSNSDVLELTMITGSDGGVYQCTVTNDAGSGTANTSVIGMYFINFLLLRYVSCLFYIILFL